MKLFVTDQAGTAHEVDIDADWPLMEAIKAAGLSIKADCGGCCLCSTCHVYIDDEWMSKIDAMSDDESMTLSEGIEITDRSRLSCQIKMTPELDGLKLTLAPTL